MAFVQAVRQHVPLAHGCRNHCVIHFGAGVPLLVDILDI